MSQHTTSQANESTIFIQYLIYAFIFFHLVGVITANIGKYKGMVSGMINGTK